MQLWKILNILSWHFLCLKFAISHIIIYWQNFIWTKPLLHSLNWNKFENETLLSNMSNFWYYLVCFWNFAFKQVILTSKKFVTLQHLIVQIKNTWQFLSPYKPIFGTDFSIFVQIVNLNEITAYYQQEPIKILYEDFFKFLVFIRWLLCFNHFISWHTLLMLPVKEIFH